MRWWLLGLMACGTGSTQPEGQVPGSPQGQVAGSVVLPEGTQAPAGATLEVRLEDVSRMDAPAEVLGRVDLPGEGPGPFAFTVPYEPDDVDERMAYSLRARVEDASGKLLFVNTSAVPVLTRQAPSVDVQVPLESVARPEKPAWAEPRADGDIRFRGGGNEPGWTVALRPGERIDLDWDYGEQKAALPWPEGMQSKQGGQVIRATTEAHDVSVAIWKETCHDTMADKVWGWRVEVTVDGRVLSGCGDLTEE